MLFFSPYITDIGTNYTNVDTTVIDKQIASDFMDEVTKFALYFTGKILSFYLNSVPISF